MKVLIFIPSFNDQEQLSSITRELLNLDSNYTILVVDDGSEPPIQLDLDQAILFRIPFNSGLGVASSVALHIAKSNHFDYFVRLDADGQHPTYNVKKILDKLKLDNSDVCIGERTNHENLTSVHKVTATLIKRHISLLSNLVTGLKIMDWNTGFFALNRVAMELLSRFNYARYPEIELYLNAHHLGLVISSLKVEQLGRKNGVSTLTITHSIRLLIRFYLILFRQIMRRTV